MWETLQAPAGSTGAAEEREGVSSRRKERNGGDAPNEMEISFL